MSAFRGPRRLSLTLLLALVAALAATSASTPVVASPPTQVFGLDDYPKRDIDEVPEPYRTWAVEEVGYIITDTEYEIFLRLQGEEQYERFMEEFWRVRDVTPGTPSNEYRELHYERLEYANKYYGRGTATPGWRTDRGRMHILLGEPQMKSRVPGEMLVYPLEVWFYAQNPDLGLPPFHYLMFYQRKGVGDYRLYSPLSDGPMELLNAAGQREVTVREERNASRPGLNYAPTGFGDISALYEVLREVDLDVASAAISYYPAEGGLEFGITPLRSEMLIADIESVPERLMPDATWAAKVLTGVTESEVRFETLTVDALAVGLIDTDGEPVVHFAAQSPGEELNLGQFEDSYYFSFETAGSLTDPQMRVLDSFEDNLSGDLDPEQARRFASSEFVYMDLMPTVPGRQTLQLMLENPLRHTFGQRAIDIDVPRARPPVIDIAGPVLAEAIQQAPQYDPFAPRFAFQLRDMVVVPAVDGEFRPGAPLLVFEQVLLPDGFDGQVTVRYQLVNAAGVTVREDSHVLAASAADANGVIDYVWNIDSSGLAPGPHRVRLTVDENSALVATADLTLVDTPPPSEGEAMPFINAQQAPPASDVRVAIQRARQYRRVGDIDTALAWLGQAREREPDDPEVAELTLEILEAAGRWDELIAILTPLAARNPRDADLMIELARAHTELGQHYDAIRYYERARIAGGGDAPDLLNALAAEYHAEGDLVKARELLERSLELDAEQPQIRQMLARISTETEAAER